MSIFTRIGSWMQSGLRRMVGVQYASPSAYTESAASPVTFDSAMQLSAVWACVKLLAETIASMPLTVYKVTESGRKIATNHPLTLLFSGKVNRYQTRIEFFETVLLNLIIHGNSYCLIQRLNGRIIGLLPLMAAQVEVTLLADGSVVYEYHHDGGVTVYAAESIWHLKIMGNGIIGLSPLDHQRNTLGIAQAAESAVTKIYRNGSKPSGVLSVDKFLTPDQREQLRQKYYTLAESNQDRFMVLEGGLKFTAISLSPQDIELLSSRKFQLSEICRWYGVPSIMINDTDGSTSWGSGIAQIMDGFYKVTVRPILEKIECSMLVNLMAPGESLRHEIEFDFNALTRGDMKTRMEAYRTAVHGGIKTPNECRRAEGDIALPGGDKLYIQGATIPLEEATALEQLGNPAGGNNGN
jgi:HK97 family phage portal protein